MNLDANEKLKLSNQLCFPLYACSREIIKAYYPFLSQLDLTYTQYIVLMALWEQKTLSVKELSTLLYLDSGTLTPLLKKLEAKGLVTRCRCPEDERCVMISITDEGMSLKDQLSTVPDSLCSRLQLTEEEYAVMHKMLYTMLDRLN